MLNKDVELPTNVLQSYSTSADSETFNSAAGWVVLSFLSLLFIICNSSFILAIDSFRSDISLWTIHNSPDKGDV